MSEPQEKAWHVDFVVDGITVEALLAALDAARAALPPLPQPSTPQQGAAPPCHCKKQWQQDAGVL